MQIHSELLELRKTEKRITAEILDKLQTMENCKGYLRMGHSSLFDYLVRGLGYSEATAYQRQACVRLASELPEVKEIFVEPMKPIKVKKTEFQDRVYLRLEFTHEQYQKIERLRALKSHKHNLESLIEDLIEQELKSFENTRFKQTLSKNPRQISMHLRNHVLKKANYRCQYPGCDSTHFLQIDHIVPVRMGGDQSPENLQVLCASHNQMKG